MVKPEEVNMREVIIIKKTKTNDEQVQDCNSTSDKYKLGDIVLIISDVF